MGKMSMAVELNAKAPVWTVGRTVHTGGSGGFC